MERTFERAQKIHQQLKKYTTSELMREIRCRQVNEQSAAKRSETAKKAAAIRWAKKKGKEILEKGK